MVSPLDYPDDHPGWGLLIDAIADVQLPEPPARPPSLRDVALEVVDTWRGTTHPALRTVVRQLHLALQGDADG